MNAEAPQDNRIPRGAIVVVVVGLLACIAAALLTGGSRSGEAAHLEWVQAKPMADSKAVEVPGGKGSMQLLEGRFQATGTNVSGRSLYRVTSVLKIDAGSPVGGGRVLCTVRAGGGTEIGQSSNGLRTTYPRSSEDGIYGQPVPETILVEFASHGYSLAVLEVLDLKQTRFTTEQGVKLEWPEYEPGVEHLKYFLPDGKPKKDLELPFYTVWKTTKVPKATTACTLTTSAGEATAKTEGALPKASPPIDEEAEEENEELKDEAEEASTDSEGETAE